MARRPDLEPQDIECVWVEIPLQQNKILIGTFYRPPNSNQNVMTSIERSIDLAMDTGIPNVIVTGDFNLNTLQDANRRKITNICQQNDLHQIITEPTHLLKHLRH